MPVTLKNLAKGMKGGKDKKERAGREIRLSNMLCLFSSKPGMSNYKTTL